MSDQSEAKPGREQLSQAPSWMLIGFIAGCIVAHWAIRYYDKNFASPKPAEATRVAPPTEEEVQAKAAKNRPDLWLVEALFEQRAPEVVWQDNLTEIVLWNAATNDFKDGIEVLRRGDKFFYRTIDKLTRVPINQGIPADATLVLTEPEVVRKIRENKVNVEVIKTPDLKPPGHEKHIELPKAAIQVTPPPAIKLPDENLIAPDSKLP